MSKYTIGLDFGTLSVRGLLLNIETGEEVTTSTYNYPHKVMETHIPTGEKLKVGWALQDPYDYIEGLKYVIKTIVHERKLLPEEIVGIGVDFTSSTILPVFKDKTPLCKVDEFKSNPHAYVKLWKHHGAEIEAEYIDKVIKERNESWIDLYGGKVSSEWMIPKVLETLRYAPKVYEKADYFIEALDYITWYLTDRLVKSSCTSGYKCFYRHDSKYPSKDFFKAIDKRLENVIEEKMSGEVLPVGEKIGGLTKELALELGLKENTAVACGIIDAHASVIGSKIAYEGDMMIIVGTSSCHMILSNKEVGIQGVGGLVKDGILPGYFAYEAGQACVGDHFDWFVKNNIPDSYSYEAKKREMTIHEYLTYKLKDYKVGSSGLLALDWFNGVRSPLMDFNLNGMIVGLNLLTKPEEIYLSLIEATAYGTRMIVESFENAGVKVNKIILGGGIPVKNKMLVQVYSDILKKDIYISGSNQASALGSAILGAIASKEFNSPEEATEKLGKLSDEVYKPILKNSEIYDELYNEYKTLHHYFSKENHVMKKLNGLR